MPAFGQDHGTRRIGPAKAVGLRRFALVIGNNAYSQANQLRNAVPDAHAISAELRKAGFEVDEVTNASHEQMDHAVIKFVGQLGPDAVGLFYYSGHGMEVDGVNYLIPVDFNMDDVAQTKFNAMAANQIQESMESRGSNLNILILDACRSTPGARGQEGGLAQMSSSVPGTVIVFATGAHKTASDNPGGANGLFTTYLLKAMDQPGLDLYSLFNAVGRSVYEASNHKQMPFFYSSALTKPFYFLESVTAPGERPVDPAVNFGADRLHVQPGESVSLHWDVFGATKVILAPDIGDKGAAGDTTVTLRRSTEYTLTATIGNRTVERHLKILVAPDIMVLEARPESVKECAEAMLRWTVTDAYRVEIDPPPLGKGPLQPKSGYALIRPAKSTTYTFTATGDGGTSHKELTVAVIPDRYAKCRTP